MVFQSRSENEGGAITILDNCTISSLVDYYLYPVHTARWNRAEPNRATLYDQSSDTTEPCWKRPTYGWGATMVQFSSVLAHFSCVHTVRSHSGFELLGFYLQFSTTYTYAAKGVVTLDKFHCRFQERISSTVIDDVKYIWCKKY